MGVDCPKAVSDCGKVITGVEDMEKRTTTGTTINRKRIEKKVRIMEIQNSTKRNAEKER